MLLWSGIAFAQLPSPRPTPAPDTRAHITLCVIDAGQTVCGPQRVKLGDTVTVIAQATPLPTSLSLDVNGQVKDYTVDQGTGAIGTYTLNTAGNWRFAMTPSKVYRETAITLTVK